MTDSQPREYLPADYTIFRYGEPGDCAYIVESGEVKVLNKDHKELARLGAGSLFGEVALLDSRWRTASIITTQPSTLIRIEHSYLKELLNHTDPIVRHLLMLLLERFRSFISDAMALPPEFDKETDKIDALRRLTLTRDLSFALEHDKPTLYYQPLVHCQTRRLLGFEALIRWSHPNLGMILPDEFIGLAEKTGLIQPLGRWVVKTALADWSTLRPFCQTEGDLPPFISINLSADELQTKDNVDNIFQQIALNQTNPKEVKIELTESVLVNDRITVKETLQLLAGKGIQIALDDFGTGFASMDYLRYLPISCLKIDKSFVMDMLNAESSAGIVDTALQLAKNLKQITIAEGVETQALFDKLTALGCTIAQGYYFSRPLPLSEIPDWYEQAKADGRLAG